MSSKSQKKQKPNTQKDERQDETEVLNPFDHALLRPDMYIGSVKTCVREMWVLETTVDEETDEKSFRIVKKKITYNPGLERIFIEIMSNAIDNMWRSNEEGIPMKYINFTIYDDPEDDNYGTIIIENDGLHIQAVKKTFELKNYRTGKITTDKAYKAELYFGEMLAGTNFTDNKKRKTSGKNGLGSKATCAFSTSFIVEHSDPENKKLFYQEYSNHGKTRTDPKLTSYTKKTGYTKITFHPDYEYFKYPEKNGPYGIDEDFVSLLKRHVYDCAMITGLNVSLNGEKIGVKDLVKYVRLYFPNAKEHNLLHIKSPYGDECVLVEGDVTDDQTLENVPHVSFVNGIYTKDGGVHVNAWQDLLFPAFRNIFNSRKPKKGEKVALKATAKQLYPYFVLFIRSEINNPSFTSQTKDELTSPEPQIVPEDKKERALFAKKISEELKKMMKWNFVSLLEEKLAFNEERTLSKEKKTKKRVTLGEKANDANFAGTKRAGECVLFITEGLSAKAFADQLISSLPGGTDIFGSFAIRGKFTNTQNATLREVSMNEEVKMLKEILNLKSGIDYAEEENYNTLRYGGVCLLTDADDDGIHIRGLLLNFFYNGWRSLCDTGYIKSLSTAVVKVNTGSSEKSKKGKKDVTLFYSNPSFHQWYDQNVKGNEAKSKKLNVKYYKGLGTHGPGEAAMYAKNTKYVNYTLDGNEGEFMELGFSNKKREQRKTWITKGMKNSRSNGGEEDEIVELNNSEFVIEGNLSFSNFVNQQLIIYQRMTLRRALPNMYDGFKEAQRKAFYGIMMDAEAKKKTVVVASLAGSVKRIAGYHHGEKSLEDTIKRMAAGFVGANNIPLLVNAGMYGSRTLNGQDAAASRYVETQLEDIAYAIFSEFDEPLLIHSIEDHKEVEYSHFMPIIPMILINGIEGIASGYSSTIPAYNPLDIVMWIEVWLEGEDGVEKLSPLVPWYRGFVGKNYLMKPTPTQIKSYGEKYTHVSWMSEGILEKDKKKNLYYIREIPVGLTISKMKNYLEYLLTGVDNDKPKKKKADTYLKDIAWKGTTNTVLWEIVPTKDFIPDMTVKGNLDILRQTHPLTNIVVIDENDYPRRYVCPEELLKDFCNVRLTWYSKRKTHWLREFKKQLGKETQKYKFVKLVIDGKLKLYHRGDVSDEELYKEMENSGLKKENGISRREASEGISRRETSKGISGGCAKPYDYLLSMQMRSMTAAKLEELQKEIDKLKTKIAELESKSEKDMWKEDLENFKKAYAKFLTTRKEE